MALSEKSTQMAWTANLCLSLISESCQEIAEKIGTNLTNYVHREQKCLNYICVTEDITRALPSLAFTSFGLYEYGIVCAIMQREHTDVLNKVFPGSSLWTQVLAPTSVFQITSIVFIYSSHTMVSKTIQNCFLKATIEKKNNRTNIQTYDQILEQTNQTNNRTNERTIGW